MYTATVLSNPSIKAEQPSSRLAHIKSDGRKPDFAETLSNLYFGDLNGDGAVNISDLGLLASSFGSSNKAADITRDGVVDLADLAALKAFWGRDIRDLNLKNSNEAYGDLNGDRRVDIADFGILASKVGSGEERYDLNRDGTVDARDVEVIKAYFGRNISALLSPQVAHFQGMRQRETV